MRYPNIAKNQRKTAVISGITVNVFLFVVIFFDLYNKSIVSVIMLIFNILVIYLIYGSSEKSIKYAENSFDNTVNAIPGGVAKCSCSGNYDFLFISNGFLKLTEYAESGVEKPRFGCLLDSVHPDDRPRFAESLRSLKAGHFTELEYRLNTGGKYDKWVLVKCVFTEDKNNTEPCLYCVFIDITESKKIEKSLNISNERFKMAMSQTSNLVFEYDASTDIIRFVTKSAPYYNIPMIIENGPSYLIRNSIICEEYADQFLDCFRSISKPETNMVTLILKIMQTDGIIKWSRLTLSSLKASSESAVWAIGTIVDISKIKEAQLRHKREEKYREAMISDAIAIYEINLTNNRYIKINSIEENKYFDIKKESYSEIIKKICDSFVYPDDKINFLCTYNRENLINTFRSGKLNIYNEYRRFNEEGKPFWVSCVTNLLTDPDNEDIKAFAYIRDIDTQKRKELAIKYSSERDPLTGLYNRKAAQELISGYLENPDTSSNKNAFLSLDLDKFKLVNDRYGHMEGDTFLNDIAGCLRSVFRSDDIIARMGGDEFIVFMKNVNENNDIIEKADMVCSAIQALKSDKTSINFVSVSIGIALSPANGDNFEELYLKSDKALYRAKHAGRNRYIFYDEKTK